MLEDLACILIFFIIAFAAYLILREVNRHNEQKSILELSKYEVNTRTPLDPNIKNYLGEFISDCFDDYCVMVLFPKNELYITNDRELEIINDLTAKVVERLSPNLREKLSQYYNDDNIDKVIADKIYITVISYVISINSRTINNGESEGKNKG